jgi:hypothetical protein
VSLGLVQTGQSGFQWLGGQVENLLRRNIDERLYEAGSQWLVMSRALAPHRTGFLAAQEGFTVVNGVLTLVMAAPYDIFQEFGTRNIRPHPHVRPALNAMARIFGSDVVMDFNTIGPSTWQGIHAHKGTFIVPSAIQPRPLTRAQHEHVRKHLMPVSAALHRGNVKRAKFRVRRFAP